jgi:hypothetical protein
MAMLPTVAAGILAMNTVGLRFWLITPLKGCGSGVGTGGPGGAGTSTMCISTPVIVSPCFAAGIPMIIVPISASLGSVQVDHRTLDICNSTRFDIDTGRSFYFYLRIGFYTDIDSLDFQVGIINGHIHIAGLDDDFAIFIA